MLKGNFTKQKKLVRIPCWNQKFDFNLENPNNSTIIVNIYNYNGLVDEKIGKVLISTSKINDLNNNTFWYEIKNKQGEENGSIQLSFKIIDKKDYDELDALLDELDSDIYVEIEGYKIETENLISFTILSLDDIVKLSEIKHSGPTPDFYITLQMKGRRKIEKTSVKVGNLKPVWNQTFLFHYKEKFLPDLIINLIDHQNKDRIVASNCFHLSDIPDSNEFDSLIKLKSTTNQSEECHLHVKATIEAKKEFSDDEVNYNQLDIQYDKNNLFPNHCNYDITVVEAKTLSTFDSNLLCYIEFGGKKQSRALKLSDNPKWNEKFHLYTKNRDEDKLIITVKSDSNKEILKVEIPAASFTEFTDKWYDLQPYDKGDMIKFTLLLNAPILIHCH